MRRDLVERARGGDGDALATESIGRPSTVADADIDPVLDLRSPLLRATPGDRMVRSPGRIRAP
jgi:hypothetical protein